MTRNTPAISVVMPVYNAQQYIKEAVDSILSQSFSDFEFIIIDDFSTDNSLDIIQQYSDSRIKLIQNKINKGIAESLNIGLKQATGKYIARMDADDISLPKRFSKQFSLLEENPDIGICGANIKKFGGWINRTYHFPLENDAIKCAMLLICPFAHPTIMFRRELCLSHNISYRKKYKAEDFDLYIQLLDKTKASNIDEVLLNYRTHKMQLTKLFKTEINNEAIELRKHYLSNIGLDLTENEINTLSRIADKSIIRTSCDLDSITTLLDKLKHQNEERQLFNSELFDRFLAQCWLRVCKNSRKLGISAFKTYLKHRERFSHSNALIQELHMMLLCILKV